MRARRASATAFTGDCAECRDRAGRPCPHCDRGRAVLATRARDREALTVAVVLADADLPVRLETCTLESYCALPGADLAAADAVRDWAASWQRETGLILCGPTGVGKSGLAVAALRLAARDYAADGDLARSLVWHLTADLVDRLTGGDWTERHQIAARAKGAAVLVLDDLDRGLARGGRDWLWSIIATRYDGRRPIIATTNQDLSTEAGQVALEAALGPAAYERLLDQAVVVTVAGGNLRAMRPES